MKTKITELFDIQYPIVQGGMIWCSGWELASAVSNAGGLGLIGAGSMYPDVLRTHIQKTKIATNNPFGVNIPLLYPNVEELMQIIVDEDVKIVFTSAGNPKTWTKYLHDNGITVAHVVANLKFATKCQDAGVDAIVAEGFEAGGHNGREETTTMVLMQLIRKEIKLPIIAAGGIATGSAILAAMVLGADGVQIGSRFVVSQESSAHQNFKQQIISAHEGDTTLIMKQLTPVRLIRNEFCKRVEQAEIGGKSKEELSQLLGKGRAKLGMFEGNIVDGELEIGQCSALINNILPVSEIMNNLINEFNSAKNDLINLISDL